MNTRYRLLTKDDTDKFITDIMKEVKLNTGQRKPISIKKIRLLQSEDWTLREWMPERRQYDSGLTVRLVHVFKNSGNE